MTDAFVTFMLRDEAERIESPGDLRALLQELSEEEAAELLSII